MSVAAEEVIIPAPELRGANFELGACRDIEVCLDGPAGTGKTFAILYKVHLLLLANPGARALVARKTNTALAGSAMVTYREMLDPSEGVIYFGGNKVKPAAFIYPNGSEMVVSGLEAHRRDKIKSSQFDVAYINEATECDEDDIQYVRSRLRNGKMGYHQLILDCNPDAPEHWLNQRMEIGKTTRLLSRHEDNPRYFDLKANDWTEEGRAYIFDILGGLTGVLLERMRFGIWAAAHGTIYQGSWDRKRNVIERFDIPREWPRYLCMDFGYTHPFVCKWYARDPDGRLYVYREIYHTKKLVEDLAKEVLILSGWFHLLPRDHKEYRDRPAEDADPLPRDVVGDHDAEDRATFERHTKLYVTPAKKSVSDGIQAVAARLRPAGDGKSRLYYFSDCLVTPDPDLVKRKKPKQSIEEFNLYVWAKRPNLDEKDDPLKENDHGMDCLVAGTMIATSQGTKPIEEMQVGDYVLTRNGYKPVRIVGLTLEQAEVYTVTFSDGRTLTGTGNHPVYLKNKGYNPLRALRYGDIIVDINSYKERYPLECQSLQQNQKLLSTKVSHSDVTLTLTNGQTETTMFQMPVIEKEALADCIKRSGKMHMERSLKGIKSTIRTVILSTIPWTTLNVYQSKSTTPITSQLIQKRNWRPVESGLIVLDQLQPIGINQRRDVLGIKSLGRWLGNKLNTSLAYVSTAKQNFRQLLWAIRSSTALENAKPQLATNQGSTISHPSVSSAIRNLFTINTTKSAFARKSVLGNGAIQSQFMKQEPVQCAKDLSEQGIAASKNIAQEHAPVVAVCSISKSDKLQPVYNLTVDNAVGEGEYFANGILVHNCDRYMVAYFDLQTNTVGYVKGFWK